MTTSNSTPPECNTTNSSTSLEKHELHEAAPRIWGLAIGFIAIFVGAIFYIMHHILGTIIDPLSKITEIHEKISFDQYFQIHLSTSLVLLGSFGKLVAILLGGIIAGAGIMISFYTHQKISTLNFSQIPIGQEGNHDTPPITPSLSTYSPGIIAIVFGALIIIFCTRVSVPFELTQGQSNQPSNISNSEKIKQIERAQNVCKSRDNSTQTECFQTLDQCKDDISCLLTIK